MIQGVDMKSKRVPINEIEDLGDVTYGAEFDAKVDAMTAQAEADVAARKSGEVHVHFRWDAAHLDFVKKAAELQGIPYQVYIKDCVFRQALRDVAQTAPLFQAMCVHDSHSGASPVAQAPSAPIGWMPAPANAQAGYFTFSHGMSHVPGAADREKMNKHWKELVADSMWFTHLHPKTAP